ncbi:MAG: HlyD family efflux transporter periplasmic adaptor subunit [Deltaproteobacteria bacterium]|nr:HlyD family efflux transporter periplasmic adaptor subunit [Deltaproteobacteria bacterium]MBW2084529.1 HlyD family efflux transporter periplasmic adaptor subunit [Deltaproteobacteria bacterium]
MEEKDTEKQEQEQPEIFEVTPAESPSENYLVIENLQRMPSLFSRGLLYLVLLALLTALIYSLVSKIDLVIECMSVARPTSHKIRLLSDRNGYIEKVFVQEGQTVEKNAPLFLIRSKEALTYRSRIEELREAIPFKGQYFDTKISSVLDELNQLKSNYESSLQMKKLKLEQNNLALNSITSDLNYWHKEIELLNSDFKNVEKLLKSGVISIREYNYTKSKLEKARTEVEKLISTKKITQKENKIIEGQIEKEKVNLTNSTTILQKEIKNLELERQTSLNTMQNELEMKEKMLSMQDGSSFKSIDAGRNENMVRAENAGIISELYFRNPGEYVRESDLLCTILPVDSPLYMDITVANKDIGFIEKGMNIKYKVDAFPYTDYGILLGRVSTIAPSAVNEQMFGMVYHIHGSLDKAYFEIKGKTYPVKAGMTAKAELVTKNKSLFSILFQKFKK